jgi:hypothetical protein
MRFGSRLATSCLLGLFLWSCAGTPTPGQPGYPFNLSGAYTGEVVVDGEPFGVSMEVETMAGGTIEGSYQVTSPIQMSGPITGTIVADSVTFSLNYLNPMDGCGGILDGTGTVKEGGDSFSGRARVNDSCGGYLAGTFTMRK